MTWPQGRSNTGFNFARLSRTKNPAARRRRDRKTLPSPRERSFDFALKETLGLCMRQSLVTFNCIGIRLLTRNPEEVTDHFCCLPHVKFGDRISQPTLQTNDRLEISGACPYRS